MNPSKKKDPRFLKRWKKSGAVNFNFPPVGWHGGDFLRFEGKQAYLKLKEEVRAKEKRTLIIHSHDGKRPVIFVGHEVYAAATFVQEEKTAFQIASDGVPFLERLVWPKYEMDIEKNLYPLLAVEHL